jgi:hypothetical protein
MSEKPIDERISGEQEADPAGHPAHHWAKPVSRLEITHLPSGAINLNLQGRQLTSPLQGFGQLWKKTYRVRLSGLQARPEEVFRTWLENFAQFQPPGIHFHPPESGIRPGEVMPIDFNLPLIAGLPEPIPMASGVRIIYADETAVTVMTPEGFPIYGFNNFSTYEEEGAVMAQVQSFTRSADPVYEFGVRFMGGAKKQEEDWSRVLENLAAHYGLHAPVSVSVELLDPQLQWRYAGNVWHNAAIRTFFYRLATPLRFLAQLGRRETRG